MQPPKSQHILLFANVGFMVCWRLLSGLLNKPSPNCQVHSKSFLIFHTIYLLQHTIWNKSSFINPSTKTPFLKSLKWFLKIHHYVIKRIYFHACTFSSQSQATFPPRRKFKKATSTFSLTMSSQWIEQLDKIDRVLGDISGQLLYFSYHYMPISTTNTTCPICLEEMAQVEEMIKLNCPHLFHRNCVIRWLEDMDTCPVCRAAHTS